MTTNEEIELHNAIPLAWNRLRDRVEVTRDLVFAHEHTLQFHFAWELARLYHFKDSLNIRFEILCGSDDNGEPLRLDLLLWIDPNFKIAIEMKSPIRSETGMNSAMTQFRMRFYRDIHRLRHLVETQHNQIHLGVFLAVVNEKGYVLERNQRVNAPYRTYQGTEIPAKIVLPPTPGTNGCPHPLKMPSHEIIWNWGCQTSGGDIAYLPGMRHFWLQPIFIEE